MYLLYRKRKCAECDRIEHALRELDLVYSVVYGQNGDMELKKKLGRHELPLLMIDGVAHVGANAVFHKLRELRETRENWYSEHEKQQP